MSVNFYGELENDIVAVRFFAGSVFVCSPPKKGTTVYSGKSNAPFKISKTHTHKMYFLYVSGYRYIFFFACFLPSFFSIRNTFTSNIFIIQKMSVCGEVCVAFVFSIQKVHIEV